MALIAIARYLTTAQVIELLWPGRHVSVVRKRLCALAGLPFRSHQPDAEPCRAIFDPPYLRRLRFRDRQSQNVDLWALTHLGMALACQHLGVTRSLPSHDVGTAFLEHSVALTDLFVALAAPFTHAGLRAAELPFQWDSIDSKALPWQEYDPHALKTRERRIVPDAVLTLPAAHRRYFIECEMGTHSIAAVSDEKTGATLAKNDRYDEFFAGRFYAQSFPDQMPAEVLYLVQSPSRRDSVNAALKKWAFGRTGLSSRSRAVTLAEARDNLLALLPKVPPMARRAPPARKQSVTNAEAQALKRFFQESLLRLDATHKELRRAIDAEYLSLAAEVRPVLARISGVENRASRPSKP